MWSIFSGRNAKLETMSRILTDAARKRTERIEELERQVEQAQGKRVNELEVVAAQRADLVNEKDKELATVREELIKLADLVNEKDKQLAVLRDALTKAEEDWGAVTDLLLRKAQAGRADAQGDYDYDVIGTDGTVIGRIFVATTSPTGTPWMWAIAYGDHEDRTPTHGYEATRQAAMRAFARSQSSAGLA
jgi:hypothetical protein